MKVTVLGIYGGYPYNGIASSSYLIQEGDFNLLLDAGSGSLLALEKVLDPLQLDAVILSHYHHDHAADLGVLQYYWQLNQGTKKEPILPIFGHDKDPLNFASLTLQGVTQGYAYHDYESTQIGPLTISFLETRHPVPAFAMRIENTTGEVLVFTADTAYFAGLVEFSRDADLLITDTNFPADKTGRKWHMTSTESAELAKNSNSKLLLLAHLPQQVPLEQIYAEAKTKFEHVKLAKPGEKTILTKR